MYCSKMKMENFPGRKKDMTTDHILLKNPVLDLILVLAPVVVFFFPLLFTRRVFIFSSCLSNVCNYTIKNIIMYCFLRFESYTDNSLRQSISDSHLSCSLIDLGLLGCDIAFSCSVSAWRKWHLWPYGHTTPARTILQTSVL